jgi:CelD/BcsL family acetyltransferase involved in cellulose biosynthesis
MNYSIRQEDFETLKNYWRESATGINWTGVCVLPGWLQSWWQVFAREEASLLIHSIYQADELLGVAPLQRAGDTVSFIGSKDVCDYLDFVTAPRRERDFYSILLDELVKAGVRELVLEPVRPDSSVMTVLREIAVERGYELSCRQEDVTLELELPDTWEGYLTLLSKKQRHEVRRKLRRLGEVDNVSFRCFAPAMAELDKSMDGFFQLFSLSAPEKAGFMTPLMKSFFETLCREMANDGMLRFGTLELGGSAAVVIMLFDYENSLYLYNSALDPAYRSLSVGILCNVLCIQESIRLGRKKWDFLKGGENYKYQIGGSEVPIYSCRIKLG